MASEKADAKADGPVRARTAAGVAEHSAPVAQRSFHRAEEFAERGSLREALREGRGEADLPRAQSAIVDLRLILESTADGVIGVDREGCITYVNAAACAMLDRMPDALEGQPAIDLFAPALTSLAHTLTSGEPMRVEHALVRRPDMVELPVKFEVRAMWRRSIIVGAVVSFSDITERIAAERARDSALAEAERLAQVRTEFLANMSHEIRTPLNAVLGLAEVAARGNQDRPPEATFRMILDSGQVLLGVVNDILDFSKIEAGKLRIESRMFELGTVIDRAVSLVAHRVFAKGLHFSVDEAIDLPERLRGDPLRLTQVLGNLLSNALKFTESGGIELRVWCDLNDLWLAVRDSGIGIGTEAMKRLFKPFEQADTSTTRRFGGSGLGLVISSHLLDLMGGTVVVRSQPGMGSTFSVSIPLHEAQAPAPGSRARVVLAGLGSIDHVPESLRSQGFWVDCLSASQSFEQPADLVVLDVDALQDEQLREAALVAAHDGQRLAMLTHPLAIELPAGFRGLVTMLEHPLRARHIVACITKVDAPDKPTDDAEGRLARLDILAAEDNEVNALVLEAILRMEGARLTMVENGKLAVERLRAAGAGAFHLVLTDIQMPEMDGYAAARAMLRLDPTLPIIGLTAHAMQEEKDRCMAVGMIDHLAKPVDVEQLVATVLRHARRGPAR